MKELGQDSQEGVVLAHFHSTILPFSCHENVIDSVTDTTATEYTANQM